MTKSSLDIKKCYICGQFLSVNEGYEIKDGVWICEDDDCRKKINEKLYNRIEKKFPGMATFCFGGGGLNPVGHIVEEVFRLREQVEEQEKELVELRETVKTQEENLKTLSLM